MLYMNVGEAGGAYMGISEAKKEASERLNTAHLATIIISDADLASGRAVFINNKEIRINGDLYDIASTTRQADKLILKVLHDEKEEGMLSKLKDAVDGWLNTSKNTKQPTLKQLTAIKDFIPAGKFSFNANASSQEITYCTYTFPVQMPLQAVLKSPPKLG